MSWSIQLIGKPEKINEKLEEQSKYLSGQSKQEFDEAKLHLQSLVSQCVGENVLVRLNASGHATIQPDGTKTYGQVSVVLEPLYGELAL